MVQQLTSKAVKNLKQLNLMCYKLEVTLSIEAWYFLHGTTDGVSNVGYFLSILSKMVTTDTSYKKRGKDYIVKGGQVDGSMLSLSAEWGIGRKAVCRLLDDFSERSIIRVDSNPTTSIISMVCVKNWMNDGHITQNQFYQSSVKPYEGAHFFLFNGQVFEVLRRNAKKSKVANSTNDESPQLATNAHEDSSATVEPTSTSTIQQAISDDEHTSQNEDNRTATIEDTPSESSPVTSSSNSEMTLFD